MLEKQQRQSVIRLICVYIVFLLPDALNGDRRPNDGRQAMIEMVPPQDSTSPPGEKPMRPKVDNSSMFGKSLQGVFAKAGSMQSSGGALINFPACEGGDEEFLEAKPDEDWIAIMYYPPPCQPNDTTANSSECLHVLDRVYLFGREFMQRTDHLQMPFVNKMKFMNLTIVRNTLILELLKFRIEVKNAMLFGASAIIILTMNPNIFQELDIAQLFSQPIVTVTDIGNITCLLKVIRSGLNLRIRLKVTYSSSFCDAETFTVWSACWRARPGSGVVCMSDSRLSKANPSLFWSYFYSALAVIMLLLLIKTNSRWLEGAEDDMEDESIGAAEWQALSCMKIKRYRKSVCKYDDSERDTCAICLDDFYKRQKIRILPCIHEFHTKCIDPWLVRHPKCPLCNMKVLDTKHNGNFFQNFRW